jgi:hypothetical protein
VESGRHADLLDEKGLYYAMWRKQVGERRPQNLAALPHMHPPIGVAAGTAG